MLETKLRERYFGDFNGKSDVHYQEVWNIDCHDANHNKFNCESVNSVVIRTSELILEIEKELEESNEQACKVILVAHGDVLQILQTSFLRKDGSLHRSLAHLETASVRQLKLE
jgi:probable phosphoglycerate mutase